MQDVGPIGTSVMASGEPTKRAPGPAGTAELVAERLVGGLRPWNGGSDRISVLASKLTALQAADSAQRKKVREQAG